jgi:hypothetical protein
MSNKDNMDLFDQLFSQLDNDQVSFSDFTEVVKNSMTEAAKKKGYDSFSQMLTSEISNSMHNEKPLKPNVDTRQIQKEGITRYEYMMQALDSVKYEPKYQGYYEAGHRTCIQHVVENIENNKHQLCFVEEAVKKDLKNYRKLVKSNQDDAFTQGYYDALMLLGNSLAKSKKVRMKEIKNAVLKMKEKA